MFVPMLDGEPLPSYWLMDEAKQAIDAADRGDPLPEPSRPKTRPVEYENVGAERGAAAWERVKAWGQTFLHGAEATKTETQSDIRQMLGLEANAEDADVKKAAMLATRDWHPDRFADSGLGLSEQDDVNMRWLKFQEAYKRWRELTGL